VQQEVMCQRVRASILQSRDRMIAARLCRQTDDVSEGRDQASDIRAMPLEGGYVYHTFGGVRRNASTLDWMRKAKWNSSNMTSRQSGQDQHG
jgi:hypothetical protein